jgi:hypothetical protein
MFYTTTDTTVYGSVDRDASVGLFVGAGGENQAQ